MERGQSGSALHQLKLATKEEGCCVVTSETKALHHLPYGSSQWTIIENPEFDRGQIIFPLETTSLKALNHQNEKNRASYSEGVCR